MPQQAAFLKKTPMTFLWIGLDPFEDEIISGVPNGPAHKQN